MAFLKKIADLFSGTQVDNTTSATFERLRELRRREAEANQRAKETAERQKPYDICVGQEYWVYNPLAGQNLVLVEGPGSSEGETLSPAQTLQLQEGGTCLEARAQVSSATYWMQPSSATVIHLMNRLGLGTCEAESFLFSSVLVTADKSQGVWMRVIIEDRSLYAHAIDEELPADALPPQFPAQS